MKTKFTVLAIAAIFALAAFSYTVQAQPSTGSTTTPPAKGANAHPAIRGAIAALERAKLELQRAKHDFGGHRADALAECDKAIQQLQLALQYAPATPAGSPPATTP
jgi:LPS O-antigen subunit length determinant protein (WzzB/FepE family)